MTLEAFGIKTNDERVLSYPDIVKELKKYKDKIEVPIDVAIDFHGRRREFNVVELFKHNQLESRISAGLVQKPLQVSEGENITFSI